MSIIITDECINCGACEPECPNNAIYEPGDSWALADGTTITGMYELTDGSTVMADDLQDAISGDLYFIAPEKCTECIGFHDEPQCQSVCPVECCIPDPDISESEAVLESRQKRLHNLN